MPKIRVDTSYTIKDGSEVVFTAPCNCNEADGLKVYYPGGSKEFAFRDAHGNVLTGIGELFVKGALVKVILDVTKGFAYIQNADTNAYLEGRFDEKAPAGYGLGSTDSKQLARADDLNNCGANGFYSWALSPSNAPFSNGIMIVATYDWARKVQHIWSAENGCAVQRIQYGASWGEREWINPPMIPGVEYRTTERWNGKAVYVQAINIGTLPNNATNYAYNVLPLNIQVCSIDGFGRATDGGTQPLSVLLSEIWVAEASGYIGFKTNTDRSKFTGHVVVKYTKE